MLEPELQNYLSGINQSLTEMKNKKQPGIWRAFFNGMFSAFGYIVGLVIMILILGFILQKTGLLAVFQKQVQNFQTFMADAQKLINAGDSQQNTSGQGSIITLPSGQQVRVVPTN